MSPFAQPLLCMNESFDKGLCSHNNHHIGWQFQKEDMTIPFSCRKSDLGETFSLTSPKSPTSTHRETLSCPSSGYTFFHYGSSIWCNPVTAIVLYGAFRGKNAGKDMWRSKLSSPLPASPLTYSLDTHMSFPLPSSAPQDVTMEVLHMYSALPPLWPNHPH